MTDYDFHEDMWNRGCIEQAMDEYAKQECIELIQFMYASCAETVPHTRPAKWNIDINTQVTFDELYNLYLQSKPQ